MIVLAVIQGLLTVMAFIGNLLVILVVSIYRKFHRMRHFLLASLALSDFLLATLVISNRAVTIGLEKWIFGTTWCYGSAYLVRVLHISTVLHLCAVSYERYCAIVRNPLNYNGCITKKRVILNITMLWVAPAVISLGPLFGWGGFVYSSQVFACEQEWDSQTAIPFSVASFVVPLVMISFLNYKVINVVRRLQHSFEIIPFQPDPQESRCIYNFFFLSYVMSTTFIYFLKTMNCRIVGDICQHKFAQARRVLVSFQQKKLIILRKMKR